MHQFHIIILLFVLNSCSFSENNEASWQKIEMQELENYLITSVNFWDRKQGMLAASNRGISRIYHTTDGGDTWELSYKVDFGLHDLKMISHEKVIAVGNRGILRTDNFGDSWHMAGGNFREPLIAVDFSDSLNGIAAGLNGIIVYTDNGGKDWSEQKSASDSFFKDVSYIDNNNAVVVGTDGTVLFTETGGKKWKKRITDRDEDLLAVHFFDTETGIAVGAKGIILRTLDGGLTWSRRRSKTRVSLLGIHFLDETGFIVGFGGTLLETDDGGLDWKQIEVDTDKGLYDIYLTSDKEGVLVGDHGTIMKNDG